MHGIHHSNYKLETNSNYAIVFSFWDRMHKTFINIIPQKKIIIGVPGYSAKQDNSLGNLLKVPFRPQKNYWLGREKRVYQKIKS
jgi:sterol desaturase/sphingolipid hydroxylase (fatty acid hydroxylase superfamily)